MHFLDSEDKCNAEDKEEVFFEERGEAKVMTRSVHEKADIAPPPAGKAPCPTGRRAHSLSPKSTSSTTAKAAGPHQAPNVPLSTQVAHQVATHGRGCKVNTVAATDMLLKSTDPQHQTGSVMASHHAPSPKPANTKTFASVASTPETPAVTKIQQASPTAQSNQTSSHQDGCEEDSTQ